MSFARPMTSSRHPSSSNTARTPIPTTGRRALRFAAATRGGQRKELAATDSPQATGERCMRTTLRWLFAATAFGLGSAATAAEPGAGSSAYLSIRATSVALRHVTVIDGTGEAA